MKYKVLFVILLATMLIMPAFAFIHPDVPDEPTPPCNTFGVKIEDAWCYGWPYAVEFHEPEDNYCDTFEVTVLAVNVTDLYGFEYKLHWNPTYFNLIGIAIEQVWADQLVVLNKTDSSWHKLVMVAMAPSPGVNDPNGGLLLATYTFHIINDVCWPQEPFVAGLFSIDEGKMSDSCTADLEPCDPINAYWKFFPKHPEVYIEPKEDINCVVGEKVIYEVWVHNITKMKSLHFCIKWKGNKVTNPYETVWLAILNLTEVVINEDVFPEASRTSSISIYNNPANTTSSVCVDIIMDCTYPLINGTFKAVDLIFEKMDPWWCGRQPEYTIDEETHEMVPDNATTPIWFYKGWIDVMCPDLAYIYFGEYYEGFAAPYTFSGTTTVATSWPDNPQVEDLLFTVEVTYDCATDELTFEAEWWNNTNYVAGDSAGMLFDADCDGWSDFEVVVGAGPWPLHRYQVFDFGVLSWAPLPSYISVYYDWGTKGHFWMTVTLPRSVLAPEPCCECYKWGIEARDMDEIGFLPMTGGDPPNPGPIPGMWLIDWPFVNYTAGENFYYGLQPDLTMGWGGSSKLYQTKVPVCSIASYNEAKFTFMPVPGDLTGDGIVNIKDLTAIAGKYGLYWNPWPGTWAKFFAAYYYDFNGDGIIDIFDIIVISKNWERTCPF